MLFRSEVMVLVFGVIFFPISRQSFILKFAKTLFKARTSDDQLFKIKRDPYAFVRKKRKTTGKVGGEISKHRTISLKFIDKMLLFLGKRGIYPPKMCWRKRRPLTRLFDET